MNERNILPLDKRTLRLTLACLCLIVQVSPFSANAEVVSFARGVLTAQQQTIVSTPIAGVIKTLSATTLSQAVKRGDVLARLDCATLKAELNAASAKASKARQETLRVQIEYDFTYDGQHMPVATEQDLNVAKYAESASWAEANAKKKRLDQCEIKAPFEGMIANIHVREGQYVNSGDPILELVNNAQLMAEFTLPSWKWNTFKPGTITSITIMPETPQPIETSISITQRGASIDANGRFTVRGSLKTIDAEFVAGMPFKVEYAENNLNTTAQIQPN